ncbi:MAG: cupin [Chloroflexi bacterium GWB2_49_20]|nr:MAG: cupin [Chloroflexi bacterium GWB2_49_20]OGN77891.1 MAG: cupin [Chloroflexi bacterium GWC2_49_37]OGN82728.1 MAG: cupin [Chloroflexi bacterium GWD2_49_16]HCM96122.1 cupin domain-containing protein [Anaerolineae bacterium]
MFTKSSTLGYIEKLKGVMLKTLAHGEKTLLTNIKLTKGAVIPPHQHPHEQTGFLITGCLDFIIDGEHFIAEPGDSWGILGNVSHGVEALEDSSVVEAFAPVREDYLP